MKWKNKKNQNNQKDKEEKNNINNSLLKKKKIEFYKNIYNKLENLYQKDCF